MKAAIVSPRRIFYGGNGRILPIAQNLNVTAVPYLTASEPHRNAKNTLAMLLGDDSLSNITRSDTIIYKERFVVEDKGIAPHITDSVTVASSPHFVYREVNPATVLHPLSCTVARQPEPRPCTVARQPEPRPPPVRVRKLRLDHDPDTPYLSIFEHIKECGVQDAVLERFMLLQSVDRSFFEGAKPRETCKLGVNKAYEKSKLKNVLFPPAADSEDSTGNETPSDVRRQLVDTVCPDRGNVPSNVCSAAGFKRTQNVAVVDIPRSRNAAAVEVAAEVATALSHALRSHFDGTHSFREATMNVNEEASLFRDDPLQLDCADARYAQSLTVDEVSRMVVALIPRYVAV